MPEYACPSLNETVSGEEVFLDANIFVYAACSRSAQCIGLLRRCATEEVIGVTTFEVLSEVTHRLMLAEAVASGIVSRESASLLSRRPEAIRGLRTYWNQVERILRLNLLILPTDEARIRSASALRASHGLLTNDSLVVAAMVERRVVSLASADCDFDRVPDIKRFAPTDLA